MRHTQHISTLACIELNTINLGLICSTQPIHGLYLIMHMLFNSKPLLDLFEVLSFVNILVDIQLIDPQANFDMSLAFSKTTTLSSPLHLSNLNRFLYLSYACPFFHKDCHLSTSILDLPMSTSTGWVPRTNLISRQLWTRCCCCSYQNLRWKSMIRLPWACQPCPPSTRITQHLDWRMNHPPPRRERYRVSRKIEKLQFLIFYEI